MFKVIEGLPKNVLGVEAKGKITDADYRKILIPAVNQKLSRQAALRMLLVAGKDFKGYDAHAMWDDAVFGLKYWRCFSCVVVVTDVAWLRSAVHLFSPFFPGVIRIFPRRELAAAKKWVSESKISTAKKKTAAPPKASAARHKK